MYRSPFVRCFSVVSEQDTVARVSLTEKVENGGHWSNTMGSGLRSAQDKMGSVSALDHFFLPAGGVDLRDGGQMAGKSFTRFRMIMFLDGEDTNSNGMEKALDCLAG
ncbi:hypothetical protein L1987_64171 [Smallanthus sonchifolius]|uniref:Uncharacterized protein n=1 Tax=Smallanthus sonchifolius TaxID=185202 RepID=A0ACB9CFC0_9ASTR|nr:hypothetical protein L1987_64171 [Smallanthus sonchifolius]